jgi:hypothetical protein
MGEAEKIADDPHDVCTCGDYRRQHKCGTGSCCFNSYIGGHGMGLRSCIRFKLSQRGIIERESHGG